MQMTYGLKKCGFFVRIIKNNMDSPKGYYSKKGYYFGLVVFFLFLFILLLVWVYNMNSQLDF
jgi:hypothetical protein